MGLCRSLRMRHKLSAAYEFTRSVQVNRGKIPALPALIRLSQTAPMGLRRSLRLRHGLRHELSAAHEFTRSV